MARFWQEFKRRRVIHVIVMYASAVFIIIELINNIPEPLSLPDWTPTFVIIILLVGFPLAVIFSWIFDVTPEEIRKTESPEESPDQEPFAGNCKRSRRNHDERFNHLCAVQKGVGEHYGAARNPSTQLSQ